MLKSYTDYRKGGTPRHYLAEKPEHLMRVPNEVLKSVFFICVRTANNKATAQSIDVEVAGTGFFLGVPVPETTNHFVYLVTAKHVIDAVKKYSVDGYVYLRLNNKSGEGEFIASTLDQWKFHPTDKSVDVAAINYLPPTDQYDYLISPASMAITEDHPDYQKIGVGDEVFVTGMFVNHVGRKRNIPIIRTGNIAMMPEEPIEIEIEKDQPVLAEVYLIESRSIGGLSGSPVFVHKPSVMVENGALAWSPAGDIMYWLGLVHGHWDVKPELDSVSDSSVSKTVNMGIAIAVPAGKVLEVVNQPEFAKKRDEYIEERRKKKLPKADSLLNDTADKSEKGVFTEKDFEEALRKVSGRNKPDDKTSGG